VIFKDKAAEVAAQVIEWRRDFHQYPEPSLQEVRTTQRLMEELTKMGIPCRKLEPTGVIGTIEGGKPGKTIALRADIDALEVTEEANVPFKSQNEGIMHACGHDTHTAMLLGAAKILNEMKENLCGNVRLLFQPAEELAVGAKKVIEQGGTEGVDMIFGMHIGNIPKGVIGIAKGTTSAAADMFTITVTGLGCHGAMPELGIDATVAAAAIVVNLQTMVSREYSPLQPLVVTVGTFHSGSRFNVVSHEAVLTGTVRCCDRKLHEALPGMMERIAQNTAAAFRCTAEVDYQKMCEPLVSDDNAANLAYKAALKIADAPQMVVWNDKYAMGSEDFADYTAETKGAFAGLGGGTTISLHNNKIVFDEDSFRYGVALHCQVAYDFLNGES